MQLPPLTPSSTRLWPSIPVVFNGGEIVPQGAILCVTGKILWFTRFGGRFQFPGDDFGKLGCTEILNDSKTKNYICHFGTKLFDALSTEHVRKKGCEAQDIGLVV